jgi:hypothetical protein
VILPAAALLAATVATYAIVAHSNSYWAEREERYQLISKLYTKNCTGNDAIFSPTDGLCTGPRKEMDDYEQAKKPR